METENLVTPLNRERCRSIVRRAASQVEAPNVEAPNVKSWLTRDERGAHERHAAALLAKVAVLPAERTAGWTDEQIDEELSLYVALAALEATQAHEHGASHGA